MANMIRLASFNVENLFERAKVFNFADHTVGDHILGLIDEFQSLIKKAAYTEADKNRILQLYNNELKPYIEVREDQGKLFKRKGWAVIGVAANGVGDWNGSVEFKQAKMSEVARGNTAQVIKDVRAHIACIVEAENRPTLTAFDAHLLNYMFKYEMLIDANDPRGIDVGLFSKFPIGGVWTHMFDMEGKKTIFSRDCLEVEIDLSKAQPLYMLCNHFKSRGYDLDGTADEKRKRQAKRVSQILSKYNLKNDWVVVAGDFNDAPNSPALQPLLSTQDLFDVLELKFAGNSVKRWTYHYNKFEQIDFILVSKALKDHFHDAGVERRGIYNLKKLTAESNGLVEIEKEYDTVTHWTNAASDHGAVWADFNLP